jgi:imidazolonepropionase
MLRVIKRLKENSDVLIKSNFLAAHAFPMEFKENHQGYVDIIINEMLPQVAAEGLADYIDAFCEFGFFSVEETAQILEAGAKYGLKPKIHANQLNYSGGIQVGVKYNAISVDHLECVGEEELACLQNSNTIGTLLPSAAFFINLAYQPARKMIDAGLGLALASDYNPGTSPSGNMNFIASLACTQLKMLPEEAINACTINGAYAMELQGVCGSITRGKYANLILTKKIPSLAYIPYSFGNNCIERVFVKGN